jgi:hypothetical protein
VVPVNCSCYARQYYQHNVNYTLKHGYETSRWPVAAPQWRLRGQLPP